MAVLFILASIIASHAQAAPRPQLRLTNKQDINLVDYEPPLQGLEKLRMPLGIMAASPELTTLRNGIEIDSCAASVVSDLGHLLTASHCIKSCLQDSGLLTDEQYYSRISTDRLKSATCEVKINGRVSRYKILSTGPCLPTDSSYRADGYARDCKGLDYALMVPENKSASNLPCLHVSEVNPKAGTQVFALGFPPATIRAAARRNAKDADGQSQFLTSGEVRAFQCSCFRDVDANNFAKEMLPRGPREFTNPDRIRKIEEQVRTGKLHQTTIDILPGMSGSGLADAKTGELYGVAQFSLTNTATVFCRGDGFYGSMSAIYSDIRENFPDLIEDGVFRCEKRSVLQNSPIEQPKKVNGAPEPIDGIR